MKHQEKLPNRLSQELQCFPVLPVRDEDALKVGSIVEVEAPEVHIRTILHQDKFKTKQCNQHDVMLTLSDAHETSVGVTCGFPLTFASISGANRRSHCVSLSVTERRSFASLSSPKENAETVITKAVNKLIKIEEISRDLQCPRKMFGVVTKVHIGKIRICDHGQQSSQVQGTVQTSSLWLSVDKTDERTYERQGILGIEMVAFVATATKDDGSTWEISKGIHVESLNSKRFKQALRWLKDGDSPKKTRYRALRFALGLTVIKPAKLRDVDVPPTST
jgi:hypothetical protein